MISPPCVRSSNRWLPRRVADVSGPVPLALSLVAVLALIGLAHVLGFSRRGTLAGSDHASSLAQGLPGGFLPCEIILARDGSGAVLRDRDGRLAVITPIGAHFVVRPVEPGIELRRLHRGAVALRGRDFSAELDLGSDGEDWIGLLADAAAGRA